MSAQTIRLSSSLKPAAPDAVSALEQAWQRRRQELAGWQPTDGWLLKPQTPQRRVAKFAARIGRA